jgi:hypothetical protein
MVEVISGEFPHKFEYDFGNLNISGTAFIEYEAEREGKNEPWYIEEIRISEMTIEEVHDADGNTASIGPDEILLLANYVDRKQNGELVNKAIEDAQERAFYG